jgi:FG-GAP-like repeat
MSTRFTLAAISAATLVLVLQGCGGGGGGSSTGGTAAPAPTTAAPTDTGASTSTATGSGSTSTVYLSSYQNQLLASTQPGLPAGVGSPTKGRTIRTFASFFSAKPAIDAFAAIPKYEGTTDDASAAVPSEYAFFTKNGLGEFVKKASADAFEGSTNGCTDPNRSLVADFNQDDIPDVFVVCTGNPKLNQGEYNQIVLSNKTTGKFRIVNVDSGNSSQTDDTEGYISNSASAATADLNGDGYPDVVVVNDGQFSPMVLINDKSGLLRRETSQRLPTPVRENYFTVNLVDIDGDGKLDLILGGSETGSAPVETRVYLNAGGNVFTNSAGHLVPRTNTSRGYIMDTLVTSGASGRTLWLLRRNPSESGGATAGREIQKVSISALLNDTATTYDVAYTSDTSVAGHLLTGDKAGAPWVQVDEASENATLKADADLEIK